MTQLIKSVIPDGTIIETILKSSIIKHVHIF